jgi:hypothetical protein
VRSARNIARRNTTLLAAAIGVAATAIGGSLGVASFWGVVCVGGGTALVTAAVYAWITSLREDFAETLTELGIDDVFADRHAYMRGGRWSELMRRARRHYRVLGTANHGYIRNTPTTEQTIADLRVLLSRKDLQIEFLWLAPDSEMAGLRNDQEADRDTIADTAKSIVWFWDFKRELKPVEQSRFSLKEYTDLPTCGLTWCDDEIIVSNYLAASLNLDSPGMILVNPSLRLGRFSTKLGKARELSELYEAHYQQVSSKSTEFDEARIDVIREMAAGKSAAPSEADVVDNRGDADS